TTHGTRLGHLQPDGHFQYVGTYKKDEGRQSQPRKSFVVAAVLKALDLLALPAIDFLTNFQKALPGACREGTSLSNATDLFQSADALIANDGGVRLGTRLPPRGAGRSARVDGVDANANVSELLGRLTRRPGRARIGYVMFAIAEQN